MNIANAPCSWGLLEFGLAGEVAGYGRVLDEIRDTGYAGTELGDWGFMPTSPTELKRELARRSLSLLGAFVPVAFAESANHDEGEFAALRTAILLEEAAGSHPFIILADDNCKDIFRTGHAGRIGPGDGLTPDQWKTFAAGVERIARAVLEKTGLRTVFHHHCGGFVETPGEIATLMWLTDPGLLGLCLDTGHYAFGGGNPAAAIDRYGRRIWHFHFKDCDPDVANDSRTKRWDYFESVRRGIFCELGKGSVDFRGALNGLRRIGYDGWGVVEQDVLPGMGSPRECADRNRKYLRTLGL